jgi:NAD/NADP transhydrogenase alpha subunit
MIIGVPKEIKNRENRVAMVPGGVHLLTQSGHRVLIEKGGISYADNYLQVKTDATDHQVGKLLEVHLTSARDGYCVGTILRTENGI